MIGFMFVAVIALILVAILLISILDGHTRRLDAYDRIRQQQARDVATARDEAHRVSEALEAKTQDLRGRTNQLVDVVNRLDNEAVMSNLDEALKTFATVKDAKEVIVALAVSFRELQRVVKDAGIPNLHKAMMDANNKVVNRLDALSVKHNDLFDAHKALRGYVNDVGERSSEQIAALGEAHNTLCSDVFGTMRELKLGLQVLHDLWVPAPVESSGDAVATAPLTVRPELLATMEPALLRKPVREGD